MGKHRHILFLLLTLLLCGCAKDNGKDQWVRLQLPVALEQTAVKSGSISLVDQLEVKAYDQDGNYLDYIRFSCSRTGDGEFSAQGTLLRGETYTLLFFAQTAGTYDIGPNGILRQATDVPASCATLDAFYAVETVTAGADDKLRVLLKRPFALLHFAGDPVPAGARSQITLNAVPASVNLLSGETTGSVTVRFSEAPCPSAAEAAFAYVLAPEEEIRIGAEIGLSAGDFRASRILRNIPVRRNYETTLRGDYFTTEGTIETDFNATSR